MRISIGNKLLTHKPNTQQEKSRYFKGLKFKTEDFSNDKIREMIGKGTTITYLYKDDVLDINGAMQVVIDVQEAMGITDIVLRRNG